MRLPWYVALDRWVRRNPSTAQTLKGCGALVIVLALVVSFRDMSAVWGLTIIGLSVYAYLLLVSMNRETLEHYADKWREEH